MIIDVHEHLGGEPDYVEKLLGAMDKAGIDMTCLSPLPPHFECPGEDAVMKLCEAHPKRLVPFGYLRLGTDGPDWVKELHARGFKGLKTHVPAANYDDKSFYPAYEKAEDLGFPILFHTGIIVVRTPNDKKFDINSSRMRPIYLDGVARSFPNLNIIAAHLGLPWHREAAAVTHINPNVYVDLAFGKAHLFAEYDVAWFGKVFNWKNAWRKVVFGGSHHGHSGWILENRYKKIMEGLKINQETQDAVLGKTIAGMIGLEL
ncbi:MAG: amidohydrolase family protein [Planctomycetota bacterium]